MNEAVAQAGIREWSPRILARMAGAFYLLTILLGVFTQTLVSDKLVVFGDAAATATNILAHEPRFRLGFAVYLIEMSCQITMTTLLYYLLKPVGRSASLLAAVFGLTGCVVKIMSRLFFVSPLLVLGGARYLGAFPAEQLPALALLFLGMNHQAETIAMVFFGLYALGKGYLVFRSGFLPRFLGVLSAVGGLGWLTYLYEPLAASLLPFILALAFLGSLSTVLWLLVVGVDERRWRERAGATAASIWR